MIFSNKCKFIFIHIQKTAGTSVRKMLLDSVDDAVWLDGHQATHMTASWAKVRLGADYFSQLKPFAFVRNPYSRLLSWWTDIKNSESSYPHAQQLPFAEKINVLRLDVLTNCKTFEDFILYAPDRCCFEVKPWFIRNQMDWVIDPASKKKIVSRIGKFETFQDDFESILKWVGVDMVPMQHLNKSDHTHYREHYSSKMRKVVEERFSQDMIHFNYTF